MAVVMAIVASWSLSIFIRLHNVSIKYDSDRALEDSCNSMKITRKQLLVF